MGLFFSPKDYENMVFKVLAPTMRISVSRTENQKGGT
jgi:hypothetical protein